MHPLAPAPGRHPKTLTGSGPSLNVDGPTGALALATATGPPYRPHYFWDGIAPRAAGVSDDRSSIWAPTWQATPGAIDRTAEELHFALTEIGFYFIVNHGVPSEQIHEVFRQAARFHALPLEKKKLEVQLDKHNVGYLPMRGDTLCTSTVQTVTKPNINEIGRAHV